VKIGSAFFFDNNLKLKYMKRQRGIQYYYVGVLCELKYDRDTGSEIDSLRYEQGLYLSRSEAEQKQIDELKKRYPTLTDKQIQNKAFRIKQLTNT